jgi:hypothetical protein
MVRRKEPLPSAVVMRLLVTLMKFPRIWGVRMMGFATLRIVKVFPSREAELVSGRRVRTRVPVRVRVFVPANVRQSEVVFERSSTILLVASSVKAWAETVRLEIVEFATVRVPALSMVPEVVRFARSRVPSLSIVVVFLTTIWVCGVRLAVPCAPRWRVLTVSFGQESDPCAPSRLSRVV